MSRSKADAAKRQRLFFALWPDAAVREQVAALSARLVRDGRVTAAENLHVTVAFLGEVETSQRDCYERVAGTVDASAFELVLARVEWRGRSGIVWLAPEAVPRNLGQLAQRLNESLSACDFEPEERPFRAHVTLARRARRPRELTFEPIKWTVRSFCLVASTPGPGGSRYTVERDWPLA